LSVLTQKTDSKNKSREKRQINLSGDDSGHPRYFRLCGFLPSILSIMQNTGKPEGDSSNRVLKHPTVGDKIRV
jgi:hypothetical protein